VEQRLRYLLVEVSGDHVTVEAKDATGQVFDRVEW